MADAPQVKAFSASEMGYITAFFSNMETKPEVNWDKVAVDAGLKDGRCARDRFRQIMAKHNFQGGASPRKGKKGAEEGEGASPTKVTKRAPRKKAVKKEEEGGEEGEKEEGEEGEGSTPAKVTKKAPRKKAVKKVAKKDVEDEEGGEIEVKAEVKGEESGDN